MRRILAVILLSLCSLACAPTTTAAEPDEVVEAYLKTLIGDDPEKGFNRLMQHSRLDEMKPAELELIKSRVREVLNFYGKPSRFELVSTKLYGASLTKILYLTVHQYMPITWEFTFYRSEDSWELIFLQMKDSLELLD